MGPTPASTRPGYIAFWCYNIGLARWIFLHFFPIGWPQLDAVYEHGLAWARSRVFYDRTRFWHWMRLPGDVVFSLGAVTMAWDFVTSCAALPRAARQIERSSQLPPSDRFRAASGTKSP